MYTYLALKNLYRFPKNGWKAVIVRRYADPYDAISFKDLKSVVIRGTATPIMFMSSPRRKMAKHSEHITTGSFHAKSVACVSPTSDAGGWCSISSTMFVDGSAFVTAMVHSRHKMDAKAVQIKLATAKLKIVIPVPFSSKAIFNHALGESSVLPHK